ncbi:GGDEF domain-containing protein [Sulfurospirillum barnesii]|uniref:diguanylate cyclase n=1 Tax=Sulfurospirillum barnesii (strain ATCC 700032 / DSM 10660 / SES-3) TaxID=760154 RepID=I3XXK9_SULBS|nr:GGDEF domain-containing protein [Sulfurospirillum barnesii]AFL68683.1 diguanylate cyclase (GGDEF) domain-containing protein [Sulfurospirillum barnesii SES-3]
MKRVPSFLIKKPLLLGFIALILNLFISTLPLIVLYKDYNQEHAHLAFMETFTRHQNLMEAILIYAICFSFVFAGVITLLSLFLKKSYLQIETLSHFDGLTGLYNRLMFVTLFKQELQKVKRTHEHLFLVIIDLDDFKSINDNFGHLVGDLAIKTTATTLKNTLRTADIIGRFGGDEFVIAMLTSDKDAAAQSVNRILNAFNNKSIPLIRNNLPHDVYINLSIGYTYYKADDDFTSMLQRADQALYISKEAGKNTATFLA